jgi:hypothetical protein
MDEQNRSTPTGNNSPGAPELGRGVTPPSAPLIEDKFTGPVFRAQPISPEKPVAPTPVAFEPQPGDDEEVDDEESEVDERQARLEYLQSLRQDSDKRRGKGKLKPFIIGLVILLVIGAGGAAAYMRLHDSGPAKKQPTHTKTQQTNQTSNEPAAQADQNSTAETKTYDSTTFSLSLEYPGDWTPEETKDKLVITSPIVTLTDATGATKQGRILLNVRARQDKPAEFTAGNIVTVLDSEKVNYTRPSSTQAGSTYISYLQYATTKTKGGLDGIYITGDLGYQYGQNVKQTDIAQLAPLVDVTFVSCLDTTCAAANQQPLVISSTSWKSDTTNRPAVETMLKSIVFN